MTTPGAIVLVGGLGTRLRSLYRDRPKALVPVCGKPFLAHQIERLRAQGIERLHLAAGYRGEQLQAWIEDHPVAGMTLTASVEPEPLGTGGGLRYAVAQAQWSDPVTFVLNGDSLLPEVRLADFVKAATGEETTGLWMSTVEMAERGHYGTVELDDQNRITAFREKSDRDGGWVNGGIYLARAAVLEAIPTTIPCSLEQDLFPALCATGSIRAIPVPPPLLDMGTPEGIARMERYLADR